MTSLQNPMAFPVEGQGWGGLKILRKSGMYFVVYFGQLYGHTYNVSIRVDWGIWSLGFLIQAVLHSISFFVINSYQYFNV